MRETFQKDRVALNSNKVLARAEGTAAYTKQKVNKKVFLIGLFNKKAAFLLHPMLPQESSALILRQVHSFSILLCPRVSDRLAAGHSSGPDSL